MARNCGSYSIFNKKQYICAQLHDKGKQLSLVINFCFSGREMEEVTFVNLCLAAVAAAKSLQSCPTLCDPIESSPSGSTIPGILQARNWTELPFLLAFFFFFYDIEPM